ncbi:MAG: hypothetical protein HY562_12715 [Ignavibacteriales bacterium]|nr:hypothetical protein [Ignavibacteriales bacterium]
MNPALQRLLVVEFRRQWTILALITPLLFLVISSLIILLPTRFMQNFDIGDKLHQTMSFLVPVVSAFFCFGIISNDVKDGWLRTLLVRAIKRQEYVLVKMISALGSIWTTILFASILPLVIGALISKVTVQFDAVEVISLCVLYFGISLTYVAILTFVSCWLPGVVNVAVLMVWGIFASAAHYYVGFTLWDTAWAVFLEQFVFPSGFFDAVGAVRGHSHTPYTEILWGIAALAAFLGLTFWSITKIKVDQSSE